MERWLRPQSFCPSSALCSQEKLSLLASFVPPHSISPTGHLPTMSTPPQAILHPLGKTVQDHQQLPGARGKVSDVATWSSSCAVCSGINLFALFSCNSQSFFELICVTQCFSLTVSPPPPPSPPFDVLMPLLKLTVSMWSLSSVVVSSSCCCTTVVGC